MPVQSNDKLHLGTQGCPSAHCDASLSDQIQVAPPMPPIQVVWQKYTQARQSAWCVTNSTVVACVFVNLVHNAVDNLAVFDFDGNRLFTDGGRLNSIAGLSAPLMTEDGEVIAADNERVIFFNRDGTVKWNTPSGQAGGKQPLSLVLTENGQVIVASRGGAIAAYEGKTGQQTSVLWVKDDADLSQIFDSLNTPAVKGNRIYVSMQENKTNARKEWRRRRESRREGRRSSRKEGQREGRLVAIDVTPMGMKEAWHFKFGAVSGASPTIIEDTIYFDGEALTPSSPFAPKVFAVQDKGNRGELMWTYEIPTGQRLISSVTRDPRGGIWLYPRPGYGKLVRLGEQDGSVMEEIDYNALLGGEYGIISTTTIAQENGGTPYLLFNVAPKPRGIAGRTRQFAKGNAYTVVIDLAQRRILWKHLWSEEARNFRNASGSPVLILKKGSQRRVVLATNNFGIVALGTSESGQSPQK